MTGSSGGEGARREPSRVSPPARATRRRTRRQQLLVTLLCALAGPAGAAAASGPDIRSRLVAPAGVAAGGRAKVTIEMALGPGWHVNSHTPSQRFLIPTTAAFSVSSGTLSDVRYPRQVEQRFEFTEEPLAVYEGTVQFEAELSVPFTASGELALTGILFYQPCNEHQCYAPAKIVLETTIPVARTSPGRR